MYNTGVYYTTMAHVQHRSVLNYYGSCTTQERTTLLWVMYNTGVYCGSCRTITKGYRYECIVECIKCIIECIVAVAKQKSVLLLRQGIVVYVKHRSVLLHMQNIGVYCCLYKT